VALAATLAYGPRVWGQATAIKPAAKARSHEEGLPPTVGEIVSLTKDAIDIKDHAGKEHKFMIDARTKYGTAKHPLKWDSFKKGEHVLISGHAGEALVIAEVPPHGHVSKTITKSHEEGPPAASGEIVSITKDAVEIKDNSGKMHKFMIDAKTKFGTAKEPVKWDQFKAGEHVLVNYKDKMALVVREVPAHGHGTVESLKKPNAT
jgi:hypothetical protein